MVYLGNSSVHTCFASFRLGRFGFLIIAWQKGEIKIQVGDCAYRTLFIRYVRRPLQPDRFIVVAFLRKKRHLCFMPFPLTLRPIKNSQRYFHSSHPKTTHRHFPFSFFYDILFSTRKKCRYEKKKHTTSRKKKHFSARISKCCCSVPLSRCMCVCVCEGEKQKRILIFLQYIFISI